MKILWMQATFGKLEGSSLELEPGLCVITAPNEWGKSTWCAFLEAMLYGVDTRERSGKNSLAVKEKYAPWSGKPMEGVLCLEHNGRRITLERRTTGRVPMGDFRAYESDSGLPIPGMTGENCGQMLLGVEKSVFTRSAFVRFTDLPVEADEALRRRLNALVTTGDENASADRLGEKLAELKRKIQYNKSGALPQLNMDLRSMEAQLRELDALQNRRTELEDSLNRGKNRLETLANHLRWLDYGELLNQRLRLEEAGEELAEARADLAELEEICEGAPEIGELRQRIQKTYGRLDAVEAAVPARTPTAASAMAVMTAALGLASAAMLYQKQWGFGILLLVLGALMGVLSLRAFRLHASETRKFGKISADRAQRREELETLLDEMEAQLEDLEQLEQARLREQQAARRLEDLRTMARPTGQPEQPDSLQLGRAETEAEAADLSRKLRQCRSQLDHLQGRMEVLNRQEDLQRQIAEAKKRRAELEKWYRAIEYAQEALDTASQELQRRFVPEITRRAGEILGLLTDGQYTRLTVGGDLGICAGRAEETGVRELRWRSDGTMDQMYLALRIAVWEQICPESPLILDDVLVRYDEDRLRRTVEVLRALAGEHQIILYSCRKL